MKRKRRYIPVTQQPFCCVPACMQMIMIRRGLELMAQEEIGYYLGLTVPKKYSRILPLARTGEKPIAGWGTRINEPAYSLNRFFRRAGIPLHENFSPLDMSMLKTCSTSRWSKWIDRNLGEDNDIMVLFDYGTLYGGRHFGHASLIDSVFGTDVLLVDPGQDVPKFRRVRIGRLMKAVAVHGRDRHGGFCVIFQDE